MNRAAAAMARHAQVVAGNKPAATASVPTHLTPQDRLMLVAMEADLVRLKEIQSHQRRNEIKQAELLPRYRAYLQELLASNQPRTPEIVVRNLIWAMDVGDVTWAMTLGKFAVAHNLPTPDGFRRDIRNLFVGDMAAAALELHKTNQNVGWLYQLEQLADTWDLIDEVRADLCKALGLENEWDGHTMDALTLYQKADRLNPRTRVKRDIVRLQKLLEQANDPA